jgi:hypothetical protein
VTALILGGLIAVAAVVLVSLPFLLGTDDDLDAPSDRQEKRLELIDERDRALAALKELEFDHQAGMLGDDEYRTLVGPLRRAAAAALQALDADRAQE